ncbi:MAG: type II toxin-antitoxin system RelE/ParE family toxin [Promethearchaeota archaeon]
MVRIEWTEHSLEDLNEIHNYISRDSKSYANLFIKKLYENVQRLKDFPKIGRIVPEINNPSVREIIFQNYRII